MALRIHDTGQAVEDTRIMTNCLGLIARARASTLASLPPSNDFEDLEFALFAAQSLHKAAGSATDADCARLLDLLSSEVGGHSPPCHLDQTLWRSSLRTAFYTGKAVEGDVFELMHVLLQLLGNLQLSLLGRDVKRARELIAAATIASLQTRYVIASRLSIRLLCRTRLIAFESLLTQHTV